MGIENIRVLDGVHTGRKSRWKKPLPDIIGEIRGKKVAVECGYLAHKDRFGELKAAGYEIIIHWPYLEVLDSTMTLPRNSIFFGSRQSYRDKPSV